MLVEFVRSVVHTERLRRVWEANREWGLAATSSGHEADLPGAGLALDIGLAHTSAEVGRNVGRKIALEMVPAGSGKPRGGCAFGAGCVCSAVWEPGCPGTAPEGLSELSDTR